MSAITKKSQWVIPKDIRDEFGIVPGESDVKAVKLPSGGYTFNVVNSNPIDQVTGISKGKGSNLTSQEFLAITRGDSN